MNATARRLAFRVGICATLTGVLLLAVAAFQSSATTAAGGTVVELRPSKTNLKIGETVNIEVTATNLVNLAAYDFMLGYDDRVLEFVGFQDSGFLASTGRAPRCIPPDTEVIGAVQAGCGSQNESPAGPGGDATLGVFTFKAIGEGTSDIVFMRIGLAVPFGGDCCALDAIQETSIAVSNASSAGATPPPTPRPDMRRLTPTIPAGAVRPETYTLDPNAPTSPDGRSSAGSSDGSGGASGSSGLPGSSVRNGRSQGSVAGANTAAGVDGEGFPVAGYGPRASSTHRELIVASAITLLLGVTLIAASLSIRRSASATGR